ncbi:MAG: sigma-70 family RNA polymerase sigma factor [bacterium]|nr:sigma-70 family RNA polymerase sigma factor [bacterium]
MIPEDQGALFLLYRDKGDVSSFERLMDYFAKPLFSYLVRYLRNRYEAEDALQEVWLKVIRQKHTYQEQGSFSAWIYRIAHNHCLDLFRKKACRTDDREIVEDEEGGAVLDRLPGSFSTPFETMVENEIISQLEAEIALLPDLIREVYILRAVQGVPFKEIADIQKAPIGTVLSRMHQAVQRLKPVVGDLLDSTAETAG